MIRRLLHKLAHLFMLNFCVADDWRDPHGQWHGGYRCVGCGKFYPWSEGE